MISRASTYLSVLRPLDNMAKLQSTFCLLLLGVTVAQSGEIITSPPITNSGVWGRFDHCPNETFARAFQLKTEVYKGPLIDDTAGGFIIHCFSSIQLL